MDLGEHTVSLADLSYKERETLSLLHRTVHYSTFREGGARPAAPGSAKVTNARMGRLYTLGLIKMGTVNGSTAIVLTLEGRQLINDIERRKHPARSRKALAEHGGEQAEFKW